MQASRKLVTAGESIDRNLAYPKVESCPICKNTEFEDDLVTHKLPLQYCKACRLRFVNPQPSDHTLQSIYNANYFLSSDSADAGLKVSAIKRATARHYLDQIEQYSGRTTGKLLELGSGNGELLVEARARGFDVTGIEYSEHAAKVARMHLNGGGGEVICGAVEDAALAPGTFDVCVLSDVLEHSRDPEKFMLAVHRSLRTGGVLFVAIPSLDSWSARLMGKYWMEFKPEHLFYFTSATLENLLFVTNFDQILALPNSKVLTPRYVFAHFDRFEVPVLSRVTRLAAKLLPQRVLDWERAVVASGRVFMARKQEAKRCRRLSVIVPVFNECGTIRHAIEQLIEKEIDGLDIKIIIVESNSTDGSREAVLEYKDHPRIEVVLENKPQGKGHAVRAGLLHASGDFVLIQDADLEYDVGDYEELLEPLRAGRAAFVLGTRHDDNGVLKMRHFVDQPVIAASLNFGHLFFSTLLNLIYGQRLKDPFTMYKVFRRDCLTGLRFECNRFDFDFELVIKLLRKGYAPVEVPVSYSSRSFSEGKKVSLFRDPITWLRALVKFRMQPLNLARNMHEAKLADPGRDTPPGEVLIVQVIDE